MKEINKLSDDELYKLIGRNVAKYRQKAKYSQLALSHEIGNKSPSLISAAELYKNNRHFIYSPTEKNC